MAQARCTLRVEGLDCPTEVAALRAALDGWTGVHSLDFDLIHGTMTVGYEPNALDPAALVDRVGMRTGLKAHVLGGPEPQQRDPWRSLRGMSLGLSGAALTTGLALSFLAGMLSAGRVLYAVAVAASAIMLVPRTIRSVRGLRLDIYVLMTLAVVGAMALGQWDEAATVAFLFGLSEALEAMSLERARRAVRALLEVAPETAEVIRPDGETEVVAARQVRVGHRVCVRAGERIP